MEGYRRRWVGWGDGERREKAMGIADKYVKEGKWQVCLLFFLSFVFCFLSFVFCLLSFVFGFMGGVLFLILFYFHFAFYIFNPVFCILYFIFCIFVFFLIPPCLSFFFSQGQHRGSCKKPNIG